MDHSSLTMISAAHLIWCFGSYKKSGEYITKYFTNVTIIPNIHNTIDHLILKDRYELCLEDVALMEERESGPSKGAH